MPRSVYSHQTAICRDHLLFGADHQRISADREAAVDHYLIKKKKLKLLDMPGRMAQIRQVPQINHFFASIVESAA